MSVKSRALSFPVVLTILVAAAFVLRIGGFGLEWLPRPGILAGALLLLHVARALWQSGQLGRWRGFAASNGFALGVSALLLLALLVRVPHLGSDLGRVPLDIDEHRLGANVQLYFVTGALGHETVEHYPGVAFWLILASAFTSYMRMLASGDVIPPSQLPVEFFVMAARIAAVLAGAATVAFTALAGRRLGGARTGLIAGFVVAIVPLAVETTAVARNDAAMVLAVVATIWASLVCATDRRRSWAIAAGALAGIATAIKYSSLFAIAPVVIATASAGTRRERLQRTAWALAGFVAAIAITNHFVWWDFPNFIRQLAGQVAITSRAHWAASDNPAAFYVMILDRFGPGRVLMVLAAALTVHGLSSRRLSLWILLSFPVLYLWFMTGRPSQFPRWVYPLVPFVAMAASLVLIGLVARMREWAMGRPRHANTWYRVTAAVILSVALLQPTWAGAVSFSRRSHEPTHARAEAWIREHAAPGDVVLLGVQWLDLRGTGLVARRVEDLGVALDGGMEQLAGCRWVVVPEPYFGHATLRRLGFIQRFHSDQGFGGSVGYDFEIYAVPQLP